MRQTLHGTAADGGAEEADRPAEIGRGDLASENRLLQVVIDAMPEWIAWKDADCRVHGINSSLRTYLERAGASVELGERLTSFIPDRDAARAITECEAAELEAVRTGRPVTRKRITAPGRDGSTRELMLSATPLHAEGEVVGVLSTVSDVTGQTAMERSLSEATRLASIGQLAAGVTHEINTPVQFVSDNTAFLDASFSTLVSAIDSLVEIASEHDRESVSRVMKEADLKFLLEDIPDAVAQSREGLKQIAQIVKAMKAFAHPGGDLVPTDVHGLIESTVDVSRNEWKYRATVDLDLAEYLPEVVCDPAQIKQVLLNLIVNAADAIEDAGGDMGVITVSTTAGDDSVNIVIADTGTGMAPEVQERIFERFFTTKGEGRGSGQGMAIVAEAVAAHNGDILIDSTPGEGTTFTIVLPVNQPEDDEDTER